MTIPIFTSAWTELLTVNSGDGTSGQPVPARIAALSMRCNFLLPRSTSVPREEVGNFEETMIRRRPNGQYVDPWFAIDAWFPVLMNQARQSTVFQTVMTALALFCVRQAQDEYRQAASALSNSDHSAGTGYPTCKHLNAQKWFQKRDILLKALKEIEEIR